MHDNKFRTLINDVLIPKAERYINDAPTCHYVELAPIPLSGSDIDEISLEIDKLASKHDVDRKSITIYAESDEVYASVSSLTEMTEKQRLDVATRRFNNAFHNIVYLGIGCKVNVIPYVRANYAKFGDKTPHGMLRGEEYDLLEEYLKVRYQIVN